MIVSVRNRCTEFDSYRAARVKSLFNCESGANFELDVEIPVEPRGDWKLGVVVGPSGSGKSSIGRHLADAWGAGATIYDPAWPEGEPIVDVIAPGGKFDEVTAALSAVGLGSVPTWLRPYAALSNGERFRASLGRLLAEAPEFAVVDEFSSVVDRHIAQIGAMAFAKAWRRTSGRTVLLSCHYDILDWLEPDWVLDTKTGQFHRGWLQRRPRFDLEVWQTDWRYWHLFEPHHYLKVAKMVAATCYVGTVDGEPVTHLAVSTRPGMVEARACRLVVMPEWQGAGVGLRFLNEIASRWARGDNRFSKPMPVLFHTSHPGLCAALRRSKGWHQIGCMMYGGNKAKSRASILKSGSKIGVGYGGHFRAVQSFRFFGGAA